MVNFSVPVTDPNPELSTGIEKVFASITVAVAVIFTAAQFPVPPDIVTFGRDVVPLPELGGTGNPCAALVNTTGLAFDAALIDTTVLARTLPEDT